MKILLLLRLAASMRGAASRAAASAVPSFSRSSPLHQRWSTSLVKLRGGATSTGSSTKRAALAPMKAAPASKRVASATVKSSGGTATIPSEVFNIVKAIVGVGVLSLPAGVAAFSGSKSALVPSILIITVIGLLSAYGFATIGKVCAYTGGTSYQQAWSLSVGEGSSWIPAYSTTAKTFLACLALSMVLKDTFTSLLRAENPPLVLLGVTCLILLPLCLRKSLASLAPFSLVGVLGMTYTFAAMSFRYIDGTYSSPASSLLLDTAEKFRPSFTSGTWTDVLNPRSLILVCMLSTAYMAHFNAPKFYLELQNNTLPRYHAVVYISFGISILLMAGMTGMGFLTFGASSSGLILNNYSPKDKLIFASRVAVAVSLVFSYPLAFQGCRDGVLDLIQVPADKRTDSFLNLTTLTILSAITVLASTLKDVSFVLAFGGATLGNLLTYVYPAIMYRAVNNKQGRKETLGVTVATYSAVLGIVMGAIGAKMAWDK